jgi:hypothetical protein
MSQFIGLLSTEKGSWAEVATIIRKPRFNEIFLLTNMLGKEHFSELPNKNLEVFVFDFNKSIDELTKDFRKALKGQLHFGDIAINISSGHGKEHMALICALLSLGVGLRFITIKNNEIFELSPYLNFNTGKL